MSLRIAQKPVLRRAGLGLIEAMISLVITATLLTAVAGAYRASCDAIDENDKFFSATQTGRVVLNRILLQIRRGAVDDTSTSTDLHLITSTSQDISYQYNANTQQILFVTNSVTTDTDAVLARNVSAASFQIQSGTDFAGLSCVSKVAVTLTITVGNNKVLLSGSAAPRRNLAY